MHGGCVLEVAGVGTWVGAGMSLLKNVAILGIAKRALQSIQSRRSQRSGTRARRA
jgi:hypothetical protein